MRKLRHQSRMQNFFKTTDWRSANLREHWPEIELRTTLIQKRSQNSVKKDGNFLVRRIFSSTRRTQARQALPLSIRESRTVGTTFILSGGNNFLNSWNVYSIVVLRTSPIGYRPIVPFLEMTVRIPLSTENLRTSLMGFSIVRPSLNTITR